MLALCPSIIRSRETKERVSPSYQEFSRTVWQRRTADSLLAGPQFTIN